MLVDTRRTPENESRSRENNSRLCGRARLVFSWLKMDLFGFGCGIFFSLAQRAASGCARGFFEYPPGGV